MKKGGMKATPILKNGEANGFSFTSKARGGNKITLVDDNDNELILGGGGSLYPTRFENNITGPIQLDDMDFKDIITLPINSTGKYVFDMLQTIDSSLSNSDISLQVLNGDGVVIGEYTFVVRFDVGGSNYSSVVTMDVTDLSEPINIRGKMSNGTAELSEIYVAAEKKSNL